jgi:hypothetical protein
MMETMDHSEVREILEDAAIEPRGLERLMAGDTPTASIVAGHLAACPDCAEELARLHRTVGLIQPTVRAVPPPELRERTLAFVAAVGRPRGAGATTGVDGALLEPAAGSTAGIARDDTPEAPSRPVAMPHIPDDSGQAARPIALRPGAVRPSRLGWIAGLAAALIVAVGGTGLLVNAGHEATTRSLTAEVEALDDVARWTLRVDSQPDVRRVALASATSSAATGSLVFSPGSTELVVVAEGLAPAPAGREYRCWVEVDGARAPIGKMFFGGALAYWVGEVSEVAGLAPDARFGVTLVDLGPNGEPGKDVLVSAG